MPISAYDTMNYAQFTPLSIQEMWAPSQQLRAQHDQLQEELAQQEQQGGLSLLGIDPVKDKAAYDIQQNYIARTKDAANQLATKGFIDSGRRRGLMELKSLYLNQVVPLQNQLKLRQERAEELRKIQLQDPTFRATANPNDVDLMTGLKNPEAFNYSGVSGNQMYKSVAEKANQLSKVIEQEHPDLIKSGLSYNYFTAVQNGASLEQVDAAMRRQFNPKDVDKMTNLMRGVVESTFNEFGVPQKFANNQQVQDELWQTASQGLYAALGSKQFGSMHDSWGEGNARIAQQKSQEEDRLKQANKQNILEDPEVVNDELYKKHSNVIDYMKSGKYKSSKRKGGFDYDAEIKKIDNSNLPQWRKDAAKKGIAQSRMFDPGVDNIMDKKIEALGKKYKTTDINEIARREQQELEKTKQLISIRYYNSADNSASKQIIENLKFSNDPKDKEFVKSLPKLKSGDVDYSSIRTGISPIKGYVVEYADENGKIKQNKIHSSKTGSPTLMNYNPESLTKTYDKMIRGDFNVKDIESMGEFINTSNLSEKQRKELGLPFGVYIGANDDGTGTISTFTKSQIEKGLEDEDVFDYLNGRLNTIHQTSEARFYSKNGEFIIK